VIRKHIEDIIIYGGTFAAYGLLIAAFYFAFFRR